jgi:transcriptional regulator with XRE-family HTH domain
MSQDHKKYPYTKQLVLIAKREGGLTHKEIAEKARLSGKSQSLVSRWLSGEALASYAQMHSLIHDYGHFLKKQIEHVFFRPNLLVNNQLIKNMIKQNPDTCVEINKSKIKLKFLNYHQRKYLSQLNAHSCTWHGIHETYLTNLILISSGFYFFKINGEIIFQYTLFKNKDKKTNTAKNNNYYGKTPTHRLQVIKRSEHSWFVVVQERATKMESNQHEIIHSQMDHCIWWSHAIHITTTSNLIHYFDTFYEHLNDESKLEARLTLPFAIRSKLIQLGHELDEVVDISARSTDA